MAYYTQRTPAPRRVAIILTVIAALVIGAIAGAYAKSDTPNLRATQARELVIPGQDWHGNVRRSDR